MWSAVSLIRPEIRARGEGVLPAASLCGLDLYGQNSFGLVMRTEGITQLTPHCLYVL